jgi:poly-beta-1,6-N-acetyl-D-glucosamine biosynthesis protein PgaD
MHAGHTARRTFNRKLAAAIFMTDSLIINARPYLGWHQRLFCDASTAMMWGLWLWLWRPLLNVYSWTMGLGVGLHTTLLKMLAVGVPVSFEGSAVALVSTSSTLLLWKFLGTEKALQPQARQLHDYAAHFGLSEQAIASGRSSAVSVVHHDEHGRIVRIEARG